jgi:hypothetical protein
VYAAVIAVLAYYAWVPSYARELVDSRDYYPSMARAFLTGKLDLGREAACARLAKLSDPYDPVANRVIREEERIHDLSYFRGRLYMYFGPTPALLVYGPWRLLTGRDLNPYPAGLIFAGIGFLANAWLLLSLLQQASPTLSRSVRGALVLVLGFATGCPLVLRWQGVYAVVILCAYALTSLSLAALWRYVRGDGRRWLTASAGFLGLALGARPNLLFLGGCLLAAVAYRAAKSADGGRGRRIVRDLWPTAAILGTMLLALAGYNYARFESPLEFGVQYQLAGARIHGMSLFTLKAVPFNLLAYFFCAPHLADHFPFILPRGIDPIELAPGGVFTYKIEGMAGIGFLAPIGVFALLAWLRVGRGRIAAVPAGQMVVICGVAMLSVLGVHLVLAAAAMRYVLDFTPWLMIPALVGVGLAWEEAGARVIRVVAGGAAVATVLGVGLFSAQYMVLTHPPAFRWLTRMCSYPVAGVERLLGCAHGPIAVEVQLPRRPAGEVEVLLGADGVFYLARADQHEFFAVEYLAGERVRFLFVQEEVAGPAVWRSAPIALNPAGTHQLVLSFGALYPKEPDARWADRTLAEQANRIFLAVDGRPLITARYERMEAFNSHPQFGRVPGRLNLPAFSGQVRGLRRVPLPPPSAAGVSSKAVLGAPARQVVGIHP